MYVNTILTNYEQFILTFLLILKWASITLHFQLTLNKKANKEKLNCSTVIFLDFSMGPFKVVEGQKTFAIEF